MGDTNGSEALRQEIQELEDRLRAAKEKLGKTEDLAVEPTVLTKGLTNTSSQHFLLLLADSQLPLGSFAFSSGLESYLAHNRDSSSFPAFLNLSLSSYASTTLPFVLAAHRNPCALLELDDMLDASIMCTVGRRASVAQGRALLSIWDRSFSSALPDNASPTAVEALKEFTLLLRSTTSSATATSDLPPASAHLGPLFGAVTCILGMSLEQSAYVFMLSHARSVISAAVRAGKFGPYAAQKILASSEIQKGIEEVVEREWKTEVQNAGQNVPVMDLWVGRHEMLYSRIFNS